MQKLLELRPLLASLGCVPAGVLLPFAGRLGRSGLVGLVAVPHLSCLGEAGFDPPADTFAEARQAQALRGLLDHPPLPPRHGGDLASVLFPSASCSAPRNGVQVSELGSCHLVAARAELRSIAHAL